MKKRVFVIVMESVGIGSEPDADRFYNAGHNDVGSNTWVHIAEKNHYVKVGEVKTKEMMDIWGGLTLIEKDLRP